jgi:hypothetical protein
MNLFIRVFGTRDRHDEEVVPGLTRNRDEWRGLAAAMGYEPRAHLDVRPHSQWLIDRVARFRRQAAHEECLKVLRELRDRVYARMSDIEMSNRYGGTTPIMSELDGVLSMIDEATEALLADAPVGPPPRPSR